MSDLDENNEIPLTEAEKEDRQSHFAEQRKFSDDDLEEMRRLNKIVEDKAVEIGAVGIPHSVMTNKARADLKPTNPKDIIATTKIDLSLFPHTAVAHGSLALMEGHLKYGAYNWRVGGILISVYLAALRRHIAKFENGEWTDAKTGVPHLANALACIAILIDGFEVDCIKDDRPPRHPDIAKMYEGLEEKVKHLMNVFPPEDSPGRYTEELHGEQNRTEAVFDRASGRRPIQGGGDT